MKQDILNKGFIEVKPKDPNAKEYVKDNYYIYYIDSVYMIGVKKGRTLFVGKIEDTDTLDKILKSIGIL